MESVKEKGNESLINFRIRKIPTFLQKIKKPPFITGKLHFFLSMIHFAHTVVLLKQYY